MATTNASTPGLLQIVQPGEFTPERPEPVSPALDTCIACLDYILDHDGEGSGLDADTLDGKDGDWYADIIGRLGYVPVNKAGDTMQGSLYLANDPTEDAEAATKKYVDDIVAAINNGNVTYNLRLFFEGTELGVCYGLNFVGPGISATYMSPIGEVTVDG